MHHTLSLIWQYSPRTRKKEVKSVRSAAKHFVILAFHKLLCSSLFAFHCRALPSTLHYKGGDETARLKGSGREGSRTFVCNGCLMQPLCSLCGCLRWTVRQVLPGGSCCYARFVHCEILTPD